MNDRDFKRFMSDLFDPIKSSIRNMVSRGVVSLIDDSLKMQALQIRMVSGEVKDNIERPQNYGFTSHPHPGAEAFTVFVDGNRDHGLTLVVDDRRYRIKNLGRGEVAIYTDEDSEGTGHRIVMKRGRVVDIHCDTLNITADNDVSISAKNITLNATAELVENSAAHRINTADYEALET